MEEKLFLTLPGFQEKVERIHKELSQVLPGLKQVDPHPQSTVNSIMSEAMDRMFSKHNRTISRGDLKRMRQDVLSSLRPIYGPYANIHGIKTTARGIKFHLNFDSVFKTPDGRLYGMEMFTDEHILFTAHSLERFEERTDFKLLRVLYGMDLTALDIAERISLDRVRLGNYSFLMSKHGYFVLTNVTDKVFVVKTFMTFDMTTQFTEMVNEYLEELKGE